MTPREKDLVEVVHHLLHHLDPQTKDAGYHWEWAKYHLGRATQGMPEEVSENLHAAFSAATKARIGACVEAEQVTEAFDDMFRRTWGSKP